MNPVAQGAPAAPMMDISATAFSDNTTRSAWDGMD